MKCSICDERIKKIEAYFGDKGTPYENKPLCESCYYERARGAENVDLSKVVIGHCDDAFDLNYLEELMNRGCYIGFDRFGMREFFPSDDERIGCLLRLLEMGYENKIVVSHDCSNHNDVIPIDEFHEAKTNIVPDWRFYHFPRDVMPILREKGVKDKQIQMMTVENPKKIFENRRPS